MRKKRDFVFLRPVKWLGIGMMAALVVACEKPVLDTAPAPPDDGEANVVLRFCQYEGEGFVTNPAPGSFRTRAGWGTTRAMTDITEICSRLNIAIFDTDGTKVKTIAQKRDDTEFGTVAMSLAAATYRLVAMFRLVLTDEDIPSNVAKVKFYYLGGSSTFSPASGVGCVNSKQTEYRAVAEDGVYEIYTMPHTEEDVLTKLTVTALDANDNIIKERLFENVPVVRNQVTRYTGSFFGSGGGGGGTGSGDFRMTADPDWDAVNGYTF